MTKVLIAVDPGTNGGIIILDGEVTAHKMPATEGDVRDLLEPYKDRDVVVYVEKVGGFVKGRAAPGSAMFNFGRNVGALIGICAAYRWEVREVGPSVWMKTLGMSRNGDTDNVWKNRLKAVAQQRFPKLKVTHATADALLILDYAVNVKEVVP
jgi:hypothetical protein